jgi:hypothetical protein
MGFKAKSLREFARSHSQKVKQGYETKLSDRPLVSNVFVGYRREPESAAPLSCVSSASGSWNEQVRLHQRPTQMCVGRRVGRRKCRSDRPFPNHEEPPAGWFCTPTDARPDHTCACKRMDPDNMCEGTPQEGPESKVWCHTEHSPGVQWHVWLAREAKARPPRWSGSSLRTWCTRETAIEPSPTADATRLTFRRARHRERKTPGTTRLEQMRSPRERQPTDAGDIVARQSDPVLMKDRAPGASRPATHRVLGTESAQTFTRDHGVVFGGRR